MKVIGCGLTNRSTEFLSSLTVKSHRQLDGATRARMVPMVGLFTPYTKGSIQSVFASPSVCNRLSGI